MIAYTHWLAVVATDYTVGNFVAAKIDPNSGGMRTFDNAQRLYPAGATFTVTPPAPDTQPPKTVVTPSAPEAARYIAVPVRAPVAAIIAEFNGAGPYPLLNAEGIDDTLVATAKAVLRARVTDINDRDLSAWLASLNYEVPPNE